MNQFSLLVWATCAAAVSAVGIDPEQIHLSLTGDASEMQVTWSTMAPVEPTIVEYKLFGTPAWSRAIGNYTRFVDGGSEHHTQWIHRVRLTGLSTNSKYSYRVGSPSQMSPAMNFTSTHSDPDWRPRLAVYGDMGTARDGGNARSLPFLIEEAKAGVYDAVMHIGDFAYNMHDNNGSRGDDFMNDIQPIASRVPYMTCPGNHEEAYNFSNYINRFTMPGYENDQANMFYSWNIGPFHVVSIATEAYFYPWLWNVVPRQFAWLKADLEAANLPEARAERPWVITMGHRPMYCSPNDDQDDCHSPISIVRDGWLGAFAMEPLFLKYKVDIAFWAHEHSYERTWPTYQFQYDNSSANPYHNANSTVHIIAGAAGCPEDIDQFHGPPSDFSAFACGCYGYGHLQPLNKTHIHWEQYRDSDHTIIDEFVLSKDL